MAGMRITTTLPADEAKRAVMDAAKDLGFSYTQVDTVAWQATKGNFAMSIFVGAFIAYCNFRITTTPSAQGTEVFIQRNKPWWTGLIGVSRVAKQAKLLAERTRDYIQDMNQSATVEEVK